MSEPNNPGVRHTDVFGFDDAFEFDVEIIPCQENIEAIIAWSAAKSKVNEARSAADTAEAKKSDDPDRPAA